MTDNSEGSLLEESSVSGSEDGARKPLILTEEEEERVKRISINNAYYPWMTHEPKVRGCCARVLDGAIVSLTIMYKYLIFVVL